VELDKAKKCAQLSGVVKSVKDNQPLANTIISIVNTCDGSEEMIRSDAKGGYSYCVAPGCGYTITGIKEKFERGSADLPTVTGTESVSLNLLLNPEAEKPASTIAPEPLMKGSVIVLENLFYDFNKSYIQAGSARELDELAAILKQYPKMTIELSAHTDSQGNSVYNQKLSEKRAQSAKQHLVNKGIESYRITAIGYGESRLRNRCTDGVECSDQEHQYNRRTEVKVIKSDPGVEVKYNGNRSTIID